MNNSDLDFDAVHVIAKVEMKVHAPFTEYAMRAVCDCRHFTSNHPNGPCAECLCDGFRYRGAVAVDSGDTR